MLVYYLNLLVILALAYPLCIRKPDQRKRAVYLACTFSLMFLLSAARRGIGNDYFSYIDIYYEAAGRPFSGLFGSGLRAEPGYLLLCKLISLTGASQTVMYAVMAVLCLLPVAWFLYRYSENLWLSTWLYVTLTFFYGTMNFVRQNLALAILLLGYPLLRRRRLWAAAAYAGVILAAASFHKTALILLPVLLLCYLPLNRWIGGAYGALALALYLTSRQLVDWITNYIYTGYKDLPYLNFGLSFVFLILPALILALVLCNKKGLEQRWEDAPLLINLVFYSVLIWLFITKHMVLERFSLYLYVYALLLVPMAVELHRPDAKLAGQHRKLREEIRRLGNTGKGGHSKAVLRRYQELDQRLSAQRALYWGLLAAVLIASFCYHEFGMHDGSNGFHGVFPYRSLLEPLNRLP
ncbi:MAG: EpsG family protein [Provencibacterium sp.]|nr:EpsG family protein [Provencibacterium sp.]